MENRPVINIVSTTVPPWEEERYNKWTEEVYYPVHMREPWVTGYDRYVVARGSPDYPKRLSIHHYTDMDGWANTQKSTETIAVLKDLANWHREIIWYGCFEMVRSFRSGSAITRDKPTSIVDDAPILHLSAFNLTRDNSERYDTWLGELGQKIYVPILMKLPGLKAINCYKWTGKLDVKAGKAVERLKEGDYPQYVSLIYFESYRAYENYATSPELAAFHEALKIPFPGGLDYMWNVQYQFTRSWRK